MDDEDRDRIIDAVPVADTDAAIHALLATLEAGELDEELTQTLAFRTGDPADFWERLNEARARWRREHGLAPAPLPFTLGE